ncbi:MAG: hypothetical protein JNN07_11140 [Verrucomicrobiales bacterium]|nr:hypothetical protein [Verrucomicrobiales bacterium]
MDDLEGLNMRLTPSFLISQFGRLYRACGDSIPTCAVALFWALFSSLGTSAELLAKDSAKVFEVNANADSGPGSFRQALLDANTSGEAIIRFSALASPIALHSNLPVIVSNVRIDGAGTNSTRFTSVERIELVFAAGVHLLRDVSLTNITIRNEAALTIRNCVLSGRFSVGRGVQNAGELTIDHSVISEHLLSSTAEFRLGGAGLHNSGNASLRGVTFSQNFIYGARGQGGEGAAIFSQEGHISVNQCTFVTNRVYGGEGPSWYFSDSTFMGFPGGRAGGAAVCLVSGTATVSDSHFLENWSVGGVGGKGVNASGAGGGAYGGALEQRQGQVRLERCTFSRNLTIGGDGGQSVRYLGAPPGDSYGGAVYSSGGTLKLIGCTIARNESVGGVAGLDCYMCGGGGNGGDARGAGIFFAGENGDIQGSTIAENTAVGQSGHLYPAGLGSGGGIFSTQGVLHLKNSILASNYGLSGTNSRLYASEGFGEIRSDGHNLILSTNQLIGFSEADILGQEPRLGELAFHGGPTPTYSLLASSPAIDAGADTKEAIDQRGYPRRCDDVSTMNKAGTTGVDIGAFEKQTGDCLFSLSENLELRFSSDPGRNYAVEYRPNIVEGEWIRVDTILSGTGDVLVFRDPAIPTAAARFYRVIPR